MYYLKIHSRNIERYGLSPAILKNDRLAVETLIKGAFNSLSGELAGTYYPLLGLDEQTFLVWVNEEDQLRIISMQKGGNVTEVFSRLSKGISAISLAIYYFLYLYSLTTRNSL